MHQKNRFSTLAFALAGAALLATSVRLPAADDAARPEPAVALDINHSGRDAILLRDEAGDGLVMFLPEAGDRWSLHLYPHLGLKITAFAAGDLNRDGDRDLVVATADGKITTWLGNGAGLFTRRGWVELPGDAADGLRIEDVDGDGYADVAYRRSGKAAFATGDGWGELSLPEAAFAALHRSGAAGILDRGTDWQFERLLPDNLRISLAASGRILVGNSPVTAGMPAQSAPLHPDFTPRTLLLGDFTGRGRMDIAAISGGARPQLQIFQNQGALSAAGSSLPSFHSIRPEIPNATVVVTAVSFSFTPNPVNINVGDSVQWSGLGIHTATSIASLSCAAATTGLFNSVVNGFTFQFNSAGTIFFKCSAGAGFHCSNGMLNHITVTAVAATPGTIPDTVTPFKVNKSATAGSLDLTWGASCSAGATASVIYEGTIGTWYSHTPMPSAGCSTPGTAATVIPAGGSQYYLVVPRTASNEGSYGTDSGGAQIPAGTGPCLPQNLVGSC